MKKIILPLTIIMLFGIQMNAQYCASNGTMGDSHEIINVSLTGMTGSINNTTPCNSLTGSQGTASGASMIGRYSDFTTATSVPIPKLRMGDIYTLYVKSKNCLTATGGMKIAYIDWNHDNDFLDSNEKLIINPTYTLDSLHSIDVTVPYGAYQGNTRMRIVYRFVTNISSLQPCDTNLYAGETEDYTINLINCSQQASVNQTNSGNTTTLSSIVSPVDSLNMPLSYLWIKNQTSTGVTTSNYTFTTGTDTGNFCVRITMQNGCIYEPCKYVTLCLTANNTTSIDSICDSSNKLLTATPAGGVWSIVSGGGFILGQNYIPPILTSPALVKVRYTIAPNGACPSTFSDRSFWVILCSSGGSSPKCPDFKTISYTKNGTVFYFTSSGSSSVSSPYTVRYNWTFSNGMTSTQKNPIMTSLPSGYNWAKLRVCIDSANINICCDSSFRDSVMNINCTMSCTITKVGDSLLVSATGGTAPRTYSWNTGVAGEKIKAINSGTYTVTVTDALGCTTTCSYTVNTTPCASFKYFTYSANNQTVTFISPIPSGYNATYFWTLGNNTTSSSPSPVVTYTSPGNYTVKLKYCLRDSSQNIICCDSFDRIIMVYPPCNISANFYWTSTSNAGTYQFIDSTTPTGTNYTYYWSFGDSTFSYQKNPVKSFFTTGAKNVCLIVTRWTNTSNQVCRDTICKTVNVSSVNPCNRFNPNFTWTVSGGAYQFSNTSSMNNFNLISINFSTSTGASYNYNNPAHTFVNNGSYSVTMTITVFDVLSGMNCTKSITKYIYVNTSICGCLKAYNTYSKSAMSVSFTSLSTCVDSSTTYLYKFGNGATATIPNPTYTYPLPGLYKTIMYVTKTVGSVTCTDSFIRYIQITTPNPCKDSGYSSPTVCSEYVSPVCGCDSISYKNSCYASKAGVKQYTWGPCAGDTNYVKICGYVYNDINRNCAYDSFDQPLKNIPIKFNTSPARYVYTNLNGYYTIYLPKGTYQLSQILTSTSFPTTQLCPASNAAITVAATNGGTTYCNNNFYDTVSTCPDLAVSIFRVNRITPGFISRKAIKYENRGATPITSVVLKYRFLSALTVLSTTTSAYSVSGNIITWNLGTLPAYSSGIKYAHLQTPVGLTLGTAVVDSVWIEPTSGDCNTANNSATYNDTCVGSYDPNDKAAYPSNDIDTSVKTIDYLVRFQNTGTAPAHNVVIEDQIDNNFDRTSIAIKANSHTMNHFYDDNGKIYFEFPNIMLPDSGTDFDASQGYVAYSVNLKKGLPIGTQLKNTALIYFDFNDPIITNTTVNTIVLKSASAVSTSGKDMNITIFPNPTSDRATIQILLDKTSQISYTLYDIQGKTILQNLNTKNYIRQFSEDISLEGLKAGIYILNIAINGKETSFKLVKE